MFLRRPLTSTSSIKELYSCRILSIPITRDNLFFFVQKWNPPALPVESKFHEKRHPFRDRVEWLVRKGGAYWEQLRNSPEKTWKRRLYDTGNYLLDRIDADEWFLKEVSKPAEKVEIIYPRDYKEEQVRQRLKSMIEHRLSYHGRLFYLSIACIPLSMALGILPGPNVFLAYNLFRLYSHDRAWYGANRLRLLWDTKEGIEWRSDDNLKVEDVITDEAIKALYKDFEMPEYFTHDIKRSIKQLEKNKLKQTKEKDQ